MVCDFITIQYVSHTPFVSYPFRISSIAAKSNMYKLNIQKTIYHQIYVLEMTYEEGHIKRNKDIDKNLMRSFYFPGNVRQ